MSIISIEVAQLAPTRETNDLGNRRYVRGTRDGAAVTAHWRQGLLMEGRCFGVAIGAFSTPITGGGAGTVLSQARPEAIISVPSGTSILPLRVHAVAQLPLIANDSDESEIMLAIDKTAAWAQNVTCTLKKPVNQSTGSTRESSCLVATGVTSSLATTPTLSIELAHAVKVGDVQGAVANALWGLNELVYEPRTSPIITGPAMLLLYWGGTVATTGFASIAWAELPTTSFS